MSPSHMQNMGNMMALTMADLAPTPCVYRIGHAKTGALRRPFARPEGAVQISLPIATAVSAIRFEKPHSLSYHDSTETKVPSITLV